MNKIGVSDRFVVHNMYFYIEHKEFMQMRKAHYKNEFSPAMLLKKGALPVEDEDDED